MNTPLRHVASPASRSTVVPLAPARLPSADAARYCGYAPRTFVNFRSRRRGPVFTRSGGPFGPVFYLVRDLDSWLEDQARDSDSRSA